MPAKLERCVRKVKSKMRKKHVKKVNPFAVCIVSTGVKKTSRSSGGTKAVRNNRTSKRG
jgi:hypothetical protein